MALIDDLRPRTLDDVVGQENAKRVVRKMIEQKKPDHLLLVGPSGTGKTSIACLAARELTGLDEAVRFVWETNWFHLNSAQCGSKEEIEEIVNDAARYRGLKIFVFDEAHKITSDSQHLLLSALEKPSLESFYFFCTTDPKKLIYPLRTRCTKIAQFTWLDSSDQLTLILRGCEGLGLAEPPKGFVREIKDRGLGNPRAILNALEAVANDGLSVDVAIDMYMPTPDELKEITR